MTLVLHFSRELLRFRTDLTRLLKTVRIDLVSLNEVVADSALAHKLARAAYFIVRDQGAFKPEKLFR